MKLNRVGQTVKAKIRGINTHNGGVNVYLSEFLCGFVPKIHTGDVPLNDTLIARKIKKGGVLKCMVIQLDPADKRCVLTAKKSLMSSQLPLIESFEGLKSGMETYGTVVSIQQYGILLSFLNDLKGKRGFWCFPAWNSVVMDFFIRSSAATADQHIAACSQ